MFRVAMVWCVTYCVVCHHPEVKEMCVFWRLLKYW
jgi:hypothetical protein